MRERRPRLARFLLPCVLAIWPAWAQETVALPEPVPTTSSGTFDPHHTRFGFELRTRWGQRVSGQFPQYDAVGKIVYTIKKASRRDHLDDVKPLTKLEKPTDDEQDINSTPKH